MNSRHREKKRSDNRPKRKGKESLLLEKGGEGRCETSFVVNIRLVIGRLIGVMMSMGSKVVYIPIIYQEIPQINLNP